MTFKDYFLNEMGKPLSGPFAYKQLDNEKIKQMYEAGYSLKEIGEEFGVSNTTIQNRLKAMGIDRRFKGTINTDNEKIKQMYEAGYSTLRIEKELGIGRTTVTDRLLSMGVKMRPAIKDVSHLDNEKIKQMYEAGYSLKEIGEEFGVSSTTIAKKLKTMGVKMRHRSDYHSTKVGSDKSRNYMSNRNITGKGTANTQYFSGMNDTGTQRTIPKRYGGNQP